MLRYILIVVLFGVSSTLSAKPFVSAQLAGQLGNQFFQIAAAYALAKDNGAEAIFPDLVRKKRYGIPENYRKIFFDLKVKTKRDVAYVYTRHRASYAPIPYQPDMEIHGYFQSEKYFAHHKDEILKLFAIPKDIYEYLTIFYDDVLSAPCTVAIHHRSYLKEDPHQQFYVHQTRDYYLKAITQFPEDALFVVCSNDILWCKWMFAEIPRDFVFIENEPYYNDLYLMSLCTHNIISNSSFSWWSAYLNANPNKIVVAPKRWFVETTRESSNDIIPDSWIMLD
jgi:hypothetical protein